MRIILFLFLVFSFHLNAFAETFWMQGTSVNLDRLMRMAQTEEQKSSVYLMMALALPQGDFNAQKIFLEMAVRTDPNNAQARHYSEYLSLTIAESLLGFYESSLEKAGIYRPLGLMHFEKDGITPLTILHEFAENTLHTLVFAFTSYPDYLEGQWSLQLKRLWENRVLLAEMRNAIADSNPPTSVRKLLRKKKYHVIRETAFVRNLLENGYMTKLPSLEDLGVPVEVDFINLSLSTIAVDLINVWNAAWLIGLPIGAHKFFHLAEDSKYFSSLARGLEHVVHHSGVMATAEKLRSIPFGLGIIPAFIVVETADGCLIGIGKMAYDAYYEAKLIEGIQFKLDPSLFRPN